jgi:hypothetical protein
MPRFPVSTPFPPVAIGCFRAARFSNEDSGKTIMNQDYVDTVRLVLAVAPEVFRPPRFALKGETALNLFVRDMPRLSVDNDEQMRVQLEN